MTRPRERLPQRRRNRSSVITWRGLSLHVCAGLTPEGRILEAFVRASRPESDLDQLADDCAVMISRLLQAADTLGDIAKGLGRLPDGSPASLVGAVVDELLRLQA